MDAFFAAVEQRDRPELRGKCVVVGGKSDRGVVTTASYEARRYGVHSAMPMFKARRLCPHAIIVPGRMDRYKSVSREIMAILRNITPIVEPVSIDEAYLDIRDVHRLFGSTRQIAGLIKRQISETTRLTCSIGAAPLRFLAKIASDMQKPNGLTIIHQTEVAEFIEKLDVRKIPGVGKVTHAHLARMNLSTLGDVQRYPQEMLINRLGKFGHRLIALSQGVDPTPVSPHSAVKSVSSENTLSKDSGDRAELQTILLHHAEDVGHQLRRLNLKARTITLKIKHADFQLVTRSKTIERPIQTAESVFNQAIDLFAGYPLSRKIRLIGVGASNFVAAGTPVQADLFPEREESPSDWERVDHTMDAINEKFGRGFIQKASLVNRTGNRNGDDAD